MAGIINRARAPRVKAPLDPNKPIDMTKPMKGPPATGAAAPPDLSGLQARRDGAQSVGPTTPDLGGMQARRDALPGGFETAPDLGKPAGPAPGTGQMPGVPDMGDPRRNAPPPGTVDPGFNIDGPNAGLDKPLMVGDEQARRREAVYYVGGWGPGGSGLSEEETTGSKGIISGAMEPKAAAGMSPPIGDPVQGTKPARIVPPPGGFRMGSPEAAAFAAQEAADKAAADLAASKHPGKVPTLPGMAGYEVPEGDGFTGVRNGINYFRGKVFANEGLNQGGGVDGFGVGFGNYLRHHLPILNANLDPNSEEYKSNVALLAKLGGPLTDSPMDPGEVGRPPDAPPPTKPGNPIGDPRTGIPDFPNTGMPGDPGYKPRKPKDPPPPTDGGPTAPSGEVATWKPTDGIADRIKGITPQTVTGTSYTAPEIAANQLATGTGYDSQGYIAQGAPDAVGYESQGYNAETGEAFTSNENLSGAIDRIAGKDSPIIQRARALAEQEMNRRGLSNSSMAVGAALTAVLDKAAEIGAGDIQNAQFNTAQKNAILSQNLQAKNKAAEFTANAANESAKFFSAETNTTGRFNAQQANEAAKFAAEAANRAAEFQAAAKNAASLFNAGEANKRSLAAAQLTADASKFAAQMEQSARELNATEYNKAQQRYVDAVNAAMDEQKKAEDQARRDAAAASNTAALKDKDIDARLKEVGMTLDQKERDAVRDMGKDLFNQYQAGMNVGMLKEMEPDARQNWLHNYNAIWAATDYLPFKINMDMFPPAGGAAPPPKDPPPKDPPPKTPPPADRNPLNRGADVTNP